MEAFNLKGSQQVKVWLGDTSAEDPVTEQRIGDVVVSKEDPICRFM